MQNFVLAYALNDSLPVFCREDFRGRRGLPGSAWKRRNGMVVSGA